MAPFGDAADPDSDRNDLPAAGDQAATGADSVDERRDESAREYARARRRFLLADLLFTLVLLLAFLFSGASLGLRQDLSQLTASPPVLVALYFAVVGLAYSVVGLPLAYASGHALTRRYGLSTQTGLGWLVDWLKELPLTGVFALAVVEAMYALLRALPSLWWLATAGILLVFNVLATFVAPVLLVPLFYRLTPIEQGDVATRLSDLARRAGAEVRGVFKMDMSRRTTAANAALVGLGGTRRIVIGDTLLDRYTPDEIEAIFAHELGHHVHHDIGRLLASQAALNLVGLFAVSLLLDRTASSMGFAGLSDFAAFPLIGIGLFAFGIVTTPLSNALSRRAESEADAYALETASVPAAFVSAMRRLANQNLAEYRPERWAEILLYSHPAPFRRVEMGEAYQRSHGGAP